MFYVLILIAQYSYIIIVMVHGGAQWGQSIAHCQQHSCRQESALLLCQQVTYNFGNVDGSTISVWEYSQNFKWPHAWWGRSL
jgi:hypothetical protein